MTDFLTSVAARAQASPDRVAQLLDERGVPLTPSAARPSSLRLLHLRFEGRKTLSGSDPEEFVFDRSLDSGLLVVASRFNLAGKSTVLNVIRWALTGRCKLRADVKSWIAGVSLTGAIEGRKFTVSFENLDKVRGTIEEEGRAVEDFEGEAMFEVVCGSYFPRQLGLDPTPFWQRNSAGPDDGDARQLGWQSYFSALHVRAGNGPLLGEQTAGGQAGTLIQVYLGLPWALTAASARVAGRVVAREQANIQRRDLADAAVRRQRREPLEKRLATLKADLKTLETGEAPAAEDVDAAVREYNRLSGLVVDETRRLAEFAGSLIAARDAADAAEARVRAIRETQAIRPLLGRIEPSQCPRCDHKLDSGRPEREADHLCFVCDSPLRTVEEDPDAANEAAAGLATARAALEQTERGAAKAAELLATTTSKREEAARRVKQLAARAPQMQRVEKLRTEVAVTAALLEREDQIPTADARSTDLREAKAILDATEAEAVARRDLAARAFRAELGREIVSLGHRFGVTNLTAADPKLGAQLKVTIGGTDSNFGDLSPGEMLRMRLATLIGLLRIGANSGVGRFPGLLLVDSPGSEEMSQGDAGEIISELRRLGIEQPQLQVVIATARPDLVSDLSDAQMLGSSGLGYVF